MTNKLKDPDYHKSIADSLHEQGRYSPKSRAFTQRDLDEFAKSHEDEYQRRVNPASDDRLESIKSEGRSRRQSRSLAKRALIGVGASAAVIAGSHLINDRMNYDPIVTHDSHTDPDQHKIDIATSHPGAPVKVQVSIAPEHNSQNS